MKAISYQRSAVSSQLPACAKQKAESRKLRATKAFTLIELLVVITIIAILAGLVVGASKYAWTKAATSRTQGEIKTIEAALEDYKADNGVYPASGANSTALYNALAGGNKKYFNFKPEQLRVTGVVTNIFDAFGTEYHYLLPGTHNTISYDLWSYGPDGKSSTAAEQADDIGNWQSF